MMSPVRAIFSGARVVSAPIEIGKRRPVSANRRRAIATACGDRSRQAFADMVERIGRIAVSARADAALGVRLIAFKLFGERTSRTMLVSSQLVAQRACGRPVPPKSLDRNARRECTAPCVQEGPSI